VRESLARAAQLLAVSALVVVLTFFLLRVAPGDAVDVITGTHGTDATRAATRAALHLDEPLGRQFLAYAGGLLRGDLGRSLVQQGQSVGNIVMKSLPVTLAVILGAVLISCALSIPLGLYAALTQRSYIDLLVRGLLSVLLACPPFFIGLLLILAFALGVDWLPAGGWPGTWPENFRFLILPSFALAASLVPQLARAVRQAAVDAMHEQWYEAALARGLSADVLAWHHVLPNSLLPVVTLVGLNVGALLAGAVVVEAVFGLPGIGQELVRAINQRDYPLVQGIVLITAAMVVVANLFTDALNRCIDPRSGRS
jgi:peptide/nickel transport system permease protein